MSDPVTNVPDSPWSINTGEQTEIWSWQCKHIAHALRQVANALDADNSLVLISFTNCPGEPDWPDECIVQAVITRYDSEQS